MKILVIIPTYNECKNIKLIIDKIFAINRNYNILVVDDSSPDQTGQLVKDLQKNINNLHLIEREGKLGLGTAYCKGFIWGIEHDYNKIIQIDADLSHNPLDIPRLIEESEHFDLVIGSRYISGINVVNWPLRRLILSYCANIYSRIITGMPIHDSTGGFKCFNLNVLKSINLEKITSSGYSFQIEMNFLAWIKGFKLKEIPIVFTDRTIGESKMSKKIVVEAIKMVPYLKVKKILGMIK